MPHQHRNFLLIFKSIECAMGKNLQVKPLSHNCTGDICSALCTTNICSAKKPCLMSPCECNDQYLGSKLCKPMHVYEA